MGQMIISVSTRGNCKDKSPRMSLSDINMYDKVAKKFLEQYKKRIVTNTHTKAHDSQLVSHAKSILQQNGFANELARNSMRLCHVYENAEWHSKVMDTLDIELIYANVDKMNGKEEQYTDNLVKELLRYFKNDFFKWTNAPPCSQCHDIDTQQYIRNEGPNHEESQYQCSGVEVYKCNRCHIETRFPRYNDPIKLLETRQGRCGEWCNVFTLILRSFGLEARYVWNKEDHVWCEYYSHFLKGWVHVDSCEASFDEPFIYAVNWNKKMSYCIAFNKDGVCDVSERYILKNALPREAISETDLWTVITFLTTQLRNQMSDEEILNLYNRDVREQIEWIERKPSSTIDDNNAPKGRQSGSVEWKARRGENGN